MQRKKTEVLDSILCAAETLFAQTDFSSVSMRDVSSLSGVTLGNIYHYFPSKEALFAALVSPATSAMETMIRSVFNPLNASFGKARLIGNPSDVADSMAIRFVKLLTDCRSSLSLLFFHNRGSAYEHYVEQFVDVSSCQIFSYLSEQTQAENQTLASKAIITDCVSRTIGFFRDMTYGRFTDDELMRRALEFSQFCCAGYKTLLLPRQY